MNDPVALRSLLDACFEGQFKDDAEFKEAVFRLCGREHEALLDRALEEARSAEVGDDCLYADALYEFVEILG
jgi:hypothetical protein